MSDRTGAVRLAFADLDLDQPANAFVYGLALGQAMEREAHELDDDLVHRAAVRAAEVEIQRADRRAAADHGRAP